MASRDRIGPALPPHLARSAAEVDPDGDSSQVAGPALPPGYKSNPERCGSDQEYNSSHALREMDWDSEDDQDSSPTPRKQRRYREEEDDGFFGPALPPGFKKQDESPERPIIGPALPPDFKKLSEDAEENRCDTRPIVPSRFTAQVAREATDSSEDEEIVIGPMPAKGPVQSSITTEFEHRAQRMKAKLLGQDVDESKPIKRESWMTELPPELKSFGLGPRTFKRRADDKPGDRSVWTDTPADQEKKAKEMQDTKKSVSKDDAEILLTERDKRLAEQVSLYNDSQRSESLMDIHHKKLKSKAAQEKNKPQERRPFDRDQDLQVHRFDEAQKRALIKKSRDLNTRFSHGKCNMFL
ncbi:GPALPP motifs-containing protein 1 isoform X1 [Hemicordylus capensis]|uniref:GPALPP motifs-containing protein 1 isoform X1 n=1 Tax=Hemicordylus capensis TaxID=884348 RepID=UPI0023028A80|nr:GPALPP motifs-containing protein 1 isoform X1 [Hemicordylus capensis]